MRNIVLALVIGLMTLLPLDASAQSISSRVAVCDPANPANCMVPASGGASSSNIDQWGGAATSLGQKAMAASVPVTLASDQAPMQVVGNVASGAGDSGNPVKVGGIHGLNPPTLGAGQRGDLQLDSRGGLYTVIKDGGGSTAADVSNSGVDGLDPTIFAGLYTLSFGYAYDGTNWNRDFTCDQSAVVNVTAGATTQIVALSGTTIIRVCSIAVSMSAAGTAQFVSGTGTNCGTGQTPITGAMPLATATPLAINGGDSSVFRAASGHALCVAAVTGNVVGVISYARY